MDKFKIVAADVEKLHNAKIDLARIIDDMEDILAPKLLLLATWVYCAHGI